MKKKIKWDICKEELESRKTITKLVYWIKQNRQQYQLDLFTLCDYISRHKKNSVELSWPFSKFTSNGLAKDKSATTILKGF